MGSTNMFKALTPTHYGDNWDDPWRTLLLLRSWQIFRARMGGWAEQKECRQREVGKQVRCLVRDLLDTVPPANPLLGSVFAHRLLESWVPDVVVSVVG